MVDRVEDLPPEWRKAVQAAWDSGAVSVRVLTLGKNDDPFMLDVLMPVTITRAGPSEEPEK